MKCKSKAEIEKSSLAFATFMSSYYFDTSDFENPKKPSSELIKYNFDKDMKIYKIFKAS